MKDLEIILDNINKAVERYEVCKLSLTADQSDILRILSTNLHYLTEKRIEAQQEWLSVYFSSKAGSMGAKEKEADFRVPQLYQIRRFMDSGNKVMDSVRSTISANKNQN
jgi:hypothetical protein